MLHKTENKEWIKRKCKHSPEIYGTIHKKISMQNELSEQTKVNAVLSYLLLWPLFLLAHSNPNLSHPFVQSHAKNASKILLITFILWWIFAFVLSDLIASFYIPIIDISLIKCVNIAISVSIIGMLMRGAYQASQWLLNTEANETIFHKETLEHSSEIHLSTEKSKTLTFLSYIPFLSASLFDRRDIQEIVRWGYIASSFFVTLFLMLIISNPISSAAVILGFFYLTIASYIIINAFFLHKQIFNWFIAKIPTRQEIEIVLLSIIPYLQSSIQEHTTEINLKQIIRNRYQQCVETNTLYREQFPKISAHILIPLLHVPIVSIISTIIAKQRKMSIYRSLFASSIVGIIAILCWYFEFQMLLGLSISYLVIISLRSRLNNDITSEILESLRIWLGNLFHHASNKGSVIKEKIAQKEEIVFTTKKEQSS